MVHRVLERPKTGESRAWALGKDVTSALSKARGEATSEALVFADALATGPTNGPHHRIMLNRYRRQARNAAELGLGELAPLDKALPELARVGSNLGTTAAHAIPLRRNHQRFP